MIDLHCHVLPGLDDGAVDVADSLAMARQAQADGIAAICATPHIRHDHDVAIAGIRGRVERLNETLRREGVACRILTGGEVAETEAFALDEAELDAVSLGSGGSWILLEPAPGPLGPSLREAVDHLAACGYRSVIAHPERHPAPDLHARLGDLVRRGALVQATAAMFVEPSTWMVELVELGLVHVLGSDAHSSRHGRPVALARPFERLGAIAGGHVEWMARDAPSAIVSGRPLEVPFEPRT